MCIFISSLYLHFTTLISSSFLGELKTWVQQFFLGAVWSRERDPSVLLFALKLMCGLRLIHPMCFELDCERLLAGQGVR